MRTSRFALFCLVSLMWAFAGVVHAELAWDGVAEIQGYQDARKDYFVCTPDTTLGTARGRLDKNHCVAGEFIIEIRGVPMRMSLQAALDLYVKPPEGMRAVAQGALPAYGREGRSTSRFNIAYKLVQK